MNALFNTGPDGTVYLRTLLHIDISEIKFQEQPDKSEKADIEILVVAYGDNGQMIDQSGKAFSLSFPREVYEKFLSEGLVNIYTFPVKKPGAYQLRLAIRDTATDKVGSANQFIEIPDLKKDRLALSSVVLEDLSLD